MQRKAKYPAVLGLLAMALIAGFSITACGRKSEPAAAEMINRETAASVMGAGGGMQSGVTDAGRTSDSLQIKYNLFIPENSDFETMVAIDLVPKIQNLYKTFKTIDRANIFVQTADAANAFAPQPYCEIEINRKIYEQINWTTVLAKDLFKVCKVTYLIREMKK